jgi:hypothetical protein
MPLAKSEMHWSVLALDPRARNRIQEYTDGRNLPAFTVGDLRAMPDKELLRIKNCGLTTVRQIRMATALHLGLPE